jgi:hypothetical protein
VLDVASALKNTFLQAAQDAANILKAILFSPTEVGIALRDAFLHTASRPPP